MFVLETRIGRFKGDFHPIPRGYSRNWSKVEGNHISRGVTFCTNLREAIFYNVVSDPTIVHLNLNPRVTLRIWLYEVQKNRVYLNIIWNRLKSNSNLSIRVMVLYNDGTRLVTSRCLGGDSRLAVILTLNLRAKAAANLLSVREINQWSGAVAIIWKSETKVDQKQNCQQNGKFGAHRFRFKTKKLISINTHYFLKRFWLTNHNRKKSKQFLGGFVAYFLFEIWVTTCAFIWFSDYQLYQIFLFFFPFDKLLDIRQPRS